MVCANEVKDQGGQSGAGPEGESSVKHELKPEYADAWERNRKWLVSVSDEENDSDSDSDEENDSESDEENDSDGDRKNGNNGEEDYLADACWNCGEEGYKIKVCPLISGRGMAPQGKNVIQTVIGRRRVECAGLVSSRDIGDSVVLGMLELKL
jgi:hypothetical protein